MAYNIFEFHKNTIKEDELVSVLTRDERSVINKLVNTPAGLRTEPIAINIISEGDRGFGENCRFYEIDAERRKIFHGDYPFRHLDKCTAGKYQFLVAAETTVDDLIAAFREAGFEVLDRKRPCNE